MIFSAQPPNGTPEANELRTDFLGRSVVLTPHRASRPHDFTPAPPVKKQDPSTCYFCPGNEHLTPPEIDRAEADAIPAGASGAALKRAGDPAAGPAPGSPPRRASTPAAGPAHGAAPKRATPAAGRGPWQMRVFPNKFPAFSKTSPAAYGVHEILVETPHHEQTLSQLSDGQLAQYLGMVARRLRAHARDRKIKCTVVFKNEWAEAGASLEHTHTQLVGMPAVPDALRQQVKLCKTACPFCLLGIDDKYPKILSSGPFLLLAPYAPRFNHETWIVPKSHSASLTDLDEQGLFDLAHVLGAALRAQDVMLGYPPYNLLFHLAPHGQKNFHFHIEICPRMAKWAGFEFGAGVVMSSVKPEWTAEEYKAQMKG